MGVKDVLGLAEALKTLSDVVKGAIGTLYEPTHLRKMADAKAYEAKALETARLENAVKAQRVDQLMAAEGGELATLVGTDVVERLRSRLVTQELHRQVNIDNIVGNAAHALPLALELAPRERQNESPSNAWMLRFFSSAADVGEPELQTLWGRLLAGEIASPGRFRARTLDVLRNLTADEGHTFARACSLVCGANDFIVVAPNMQGTVLAGCRDMDAMGDCGLTFVDMTTLVDARLLHPETDLVWGSEKFPVVLSYNGRWLTVEKSAAPPTVGTMVRNIHNQSNAVVSFPIIKFSEAGRELGLLVPDSPNEAYLRLLHERLGLFGLTLTVSDQMPSTAEPLQASHPRA